MSLSPQQQGRHFKSIAVAAARAADDKKGSDITLLHVRPVTSVADYLLLVSITSPAHMKAVQANIETMLKNVGTYAHHRDGRDSDLWRVLDYGGLMVHVVHPRAREFYQLDRLFHDAKSVAWGMKKPKKTVKSKTRGKKIKRTKKAKKASKPRKKKSKKRPAAKRRSK